MKNTYLGLPKFFDKIKSSMTCRYSLDFSLSLSKAIFFSFLFLLIAFLSSCQSLHLNFFPFLSFFSLSVSTFFSSYISLFLPLFPYNFLIFAFISQFSHFIFFSFLFFSIFSFISSPSPVFCIPTLFFVSWSLYFFQWHFTCFAEKFLFEPCHFADKFSFKQCLSTVLYLVVGGLARFP